MILYLSFFLSWFYTYPCHICICLYSFLRISSSPNNWILPFRWFLAFWWHLRWSMVSIQAIYVWIKVKEALAKWDQSATITPSKRGQEHTTRGNVYVYELLSVCMCMYVCVCMCPARLNQSIQSSLLVLPNGGCLSFYEFCFEPVAVCVWGTTSISPMHWCHGRTSCTHLAAAAPKCCRRKKKKGKKNCHLLLNRSSLFTDKNLVITIRREGNRNHTEQIL